MDVDVRACTDCRTVAVISMRRYGRIGFCWIQSRQDWRSHTVTFLQEFLCVRVMTHGCMGFPQNGHYLTLANAPAHSHRQNVCRMHSTLNRDPDDVIH